MFDLVIKDAEIFDGAGSAPVRGDLGVTAGKIAAIGKYEGGGKLGAAKETVKADGLALAPGIIDGHTHYDAQITWDPFVDPSPALGVTTAVLGNCGFTIAPCKPPCVPPTSGRLEMSPGTLYSTSDQISRPPGVLCRSSWLSVTLTFALVVSTTGDSPDTFTVSASAATLRICSIGVVWPTLTTMSLRTIDWNPCSSSLTV